MNIKGFSFILFSFILLLSFSSSSVIAQCCSAGNPVGGNIESESIEKKDLIILFDYHHSISKYYYHEDERQDISFIENSYFDFAKLALRFGLHPRYSIGTEMGFFFNKTQNLSFPTGKQQIQAEGFGDLGISFNANLLKKLYFNPNKLILSVGMTLPIGDFNEQMDGVVIPISLQPSSGTPKYNISLYYSYKNKEKQIGWNLRSYYEYRTPIDKNFLYHQYGSLIILEPGIFYTNSKNISLSLKGKVEYHSVDHRENNILIESSGGVFTSICPGVYIKLKNNFGVLASFDIPIYRFVNGYQLTNYYAFRLGILKKINLS